jgi:hypothetical protein
MNNINLNENQIYTNCFTQRTKSGQIFLLGILVCGIIVNIAQFCAIEERINFINYSASKSYGTHDLVEISHKYAGPTSKSRFSPYLTLSKTAPGVEIFMPVDCTLTAERLYGLGRAGNVIRFNYDEEMLLSELDFAKYEIKILGGVEDRDQGVVAIIMKKQNPQALIVLRSDEIWYLVDKSLFPEEAIKEIF